MNLLLYTTNLSAALEAYTELLKQLQRVATAAFTGYDVGAMCASVLALAFSAVVAILHCAGDSHSTVVGLSEHLLKFLPYPPLSVISSL